MYNTKKKKKITIFLYAVLSVYRIAQSCGTSVLQKVSVIVSSRSRAEGRRGAGICERSDLFVLVPPSARSGGLGKMQTNTTHRLWLGRSLQGIPAKGHLNGARTSTATRLSASQAALCSQKASRDTEIKSEFNTARRKQANSLTNSNPGASASRCVNVPWLESLNQSNVTLNSLNLCSSLSSILPHECYFLQF